MEKIILGLVFMLSVVSFGQEKEFSFTKEKGFTEYVVIDKIGQTDKELYQKALGWINETYKNPEKVILAKNDNSYIRIEGMDSNISWMKVMGMTTYYSTKYEIEFYFKDGKVKFDITSVNTYTEATKYASGGWSKRHYYSMPLDERTSDLIFKEDGTFRNNYRDIQTNVEYYNGLVKSMDIYLRGEAKSQASNW
ncbi:DUF4468 domain-containing protein [Flavobacterium sp. ZT3R18]|uniref:DUF4468 domain-containing protein n=1 Tax=Flavobacterium sp. ZT3R18 TaxID=2594429 RepID=UPI00117AED67|nr:DUF4468 domain-containing protein [Flavobacterium sp. ZT3R18]TRX37980.1 DUF4468 domain-containing protein [Flavobacterium sp. ZT3R18]